MALTHLIIGAGNMGGALLSAWIGSGLIGNRNLAILDPRPGNDAVFAIERGAKHLSEPTDIPKTIDTVLLGIKPQMFADLKSDLAQAIPDGALIISIMAGVPLSALADAFPACAVVRAMPNTPASIGKGVTAYVPDIKSVDDPLIERTEALLGSFGTVLQLDSDDQINQVTGVSGSGPAYIFHVCEALTAAGVSAGLSAEDAASLARQTVIGAAALLEASDRTPRQLREAVTSPNGTTQAALDVLMGPDGIGEPFALAVQAAVRRADELST